MKTLAVPLLLSLFMLTFSACGKKESAPEPEVKSTEESTTELMAEADAIIETVEAEVEQVVAQAEEQIVELQEEAEELIETEVAAVVEEVEETVAEIEQKANEAVADQLQESANSAIKDLF